jgi:hypothetical protein
LILAAALVGAGVVGAAASASTPATSTVTVPATPGQTVTASWTGTIPPGTDPLSDCNDAATSDAHGITFAVPSGAYNTVNATVTVKVHWVPSNPSGAEDVNDEILTVNDGSGTEVGSSDSGSTTESLSFNNPKAGTYTALACGFVNSTSQDYTASVSVTTEPANAPAPPLVDNGGLQFSASVPADPQRNEAEPAVTTDKDGLVYTCGPNGFSNIADYAQVSTDGGETFHLLGTAPRGQISTPPQGGGDCALATSPVKAAGAKSYTLAYAGLGPLTGFSTFTSTDGGKTLNGSPDSESFPGTDRQWITFTDAKTAFFVYNSSALPGGQTVQKSTDGGFTYAPVGQSVATDGSRVGQIHAILRTSAGAVTTDPAKADATKAIVYFPYSTADSVKLAMSQDGGTTWSQCLAVKTDVSPDAGFVSADADSAGNIYVAYAEKGGGRDVYLVALPGSDLTKCKGGNADSAKNNVNPGFGPKIRMDRGGVETTVMPWVAAGGAPGRVAVAYYGTKSVGDPNTAAFKASWDVYVDQVLNAFNGDGSPASSPGVGQVKATTHPFHYDSICLDGLACDTTENGDRSLADYFTIEYNRGNGRLVLVYDQSYKHPGDATGPFATAAVVSQISGPSNGGGTVAVAGRSVVRTSSPDAAGDAIENYSELVPGGLTPRLTTPTELPALDLVGNPAVKVGPAADGGFTVTMTYKDLSDAALQQALSDPATQLVYVFRWVNGFQPASASAHYDPAQGWTFGVDQFTQTTGNPGGDVEIYPGATAIKGAVKGNSIVMTVPASALKALSGGTGPGQRPTEVKATAGSRLYDGTALTFTSLVPNAGGLPAQSYLDTIDEAPAFDFLVPAAATTSTGSGPTTSGPSGSGSSGGGSPGGGSLAATGLASGWPLLGLVLLTGGLVVRRRRRPVR